MAIAPQNVTRHAPFATLAPPTRAAMAPRTGEEHERERGNAAHGGRGRGEERGDERHGRAGRECSGGRQRGLDRAGAQRLGEAELIARVRGERVLGRELPRDLGCEPRVEAAADVDRGELAVLRLRIVLELRGARARDRSARCRPAS